uniref:Uncharacterized protein n=1 Tax=Musa acuminata subsp. malaccensis TaxID=214687 RepID=A0A804KNI1_MUSAM
MLHPLFARRGRLLSPQSPTAMMMRAMIRWHGTLLRLSHAELFCYSNPRCPGCNVAALVPCQSSPSMMKRLSEI